MPETIGIGETGNKHIALWCEIISEGAVVNFKVINGGWTGTLHEDGSVSHQMGVNPGPYAVLWRGAVPAAHSHDYNAAISWIDEQLRVPDGS